jgi:hypothetical protein
VRLASRFSRPAQLTLIKIRSQESYSVADTDPRTGRLLDVGTSDMEKQGSAKKSDGFFEKGLLRALETQHRGAGGTPEVKVVGNGHCHGKGHFALSLFCETL